ncbi:MAG: VOC family protein [Pseudomonadales bacterium]|nr:VOC family protein [Pseudomonadales bacterium]
MIGYTTVGTNDLERAGSFYDALFAELGAGRAMATDRLIMWTDKPGNPMFGVITPFDEKPCSAGNGVMISLAVGNPEIVAKLHAKALELGGSDEGEPGPRGEGGANFGYVRDLDGNKLAFYCMS